MRSGSVLAVAGLSREARIAAGDGVETLQAGGRPSVLRDRLGLLPDRPLRAVISFGIAGGLEPGLAPGDLVIGTSVIVTDGESERRLPCDPDIVAAHAKHLSALGRRVVTADVAGVEDAILTTEAKASLRARTGAAAVDMESHVAADFAARRSLPFAILRVVCDPAERALPAFAAAALKPNGDPDILGVLRALVRREARPRELVRLARDSGEAFRGLSGARALLGLALGVDA